MRSEQDVSINPRVSWPRSIVNLFRATRKAARRFCDPYETVCNNGIRAMPRIFIVSPALSGTAGIIEAAAGITNVEN